MAMNYTVSPALPLPADLDEVAGIISESYFNPQGREFVVVCVWGKDVGNNQAAYLAWYFSEEQFRANQPGRQPRWERIALPTLRGILRNSLVFAWGMLRQIATTNAPDETGVRRQVMHTIDLLDVRGLGD
jgi:hypothetical protein